MPLILEAIFFGVAIAFIVVGLVGTVIPIIPGMIIIWLTLLAYAIVDGFQAIDWITFIFLTLVALITGTADIWMSILGSKKAGASGRSIILGTIGAVVGFIVLSGVIPVIGSLVGGILGYMIGVLLGQYHKYRDWNMAVKASLGGLAGWGIATAIELAGGVLILVIFVWQVLSY